MPMNPAPPSEPKARVAVIASVAFALLIAVSVATPLPAIAQEALYPWAKTLDSYVDPEGDYYMQRLGDLFKDGLVTVVDDEPAAEEPDPEPESGTEPEGETEGEGTEGEPVETPASRIKVSVDEKSGAMVVEGKSEDLTSVSFAIDKTYNFDENLVSRFSLDASAAKGQRVKLGFFLDDAAGDSAGDGAGEGAEPFATLTLTKQREKSGWAYSKENSQDVTEHAISGEHRISFRVLDCSDGKVSFCVKSFEMCQSIVPTIYFEIDESEGTVDAMNASEDHSVECYGNMRIRVPEGYQSEYASAGEGASESGVYEMEYIRGRGNSTWKEKKKPYKVKLASKADLFGMGASKHWVLLANSLDNSLLRNKYTYALGDQLGMPFTPQSITVDVVMNGQYYGSYVLSEQVRVEESRVDIRDLTKSKYQSETDETKIDGGYLLSMFSHDKSSTNKSFVTKRGLPLTIEAPEFEDYYNEAQFAYIKNYMKKVENALFGDNFCDADGHSYKEYVDLDAAAMYYWVQNFSKNGDAFTSDSTFMYKDHDGKLCFGPLWDFDFVAWGSTNYEDLYTKGWISDNSHWMDRMLEDPDFQAKIREQWPIIKGKVQDAIADGGVLDQYVRKSEISASYNFEKWGPSHFGNNEGVANPDSETVGKQVGLSYSDEINRLKDWTAQRLEWVDENLDSLFPKQTTVTFKGADGNVVEERDGLVGREMTDLPAAPEKPGYVFEGWHYAYDIPLDEFFASIGYTRESYVQGLIDEGMTPEEIEEHLNMLRENCHKEDTVRSSFTVYDNLVLTALYAKESSLAKPVAVFTSQERYNVVVTGDKIYGTGDQCLDASVVPADAYGLLTYETSDPDVATVNDDGVVTGVGSGHCTVTARAIGGVSKTVDVYAYTVEEHEAMEESESSEVEVQTELTVPCGKYAQISVKPVVEYTTAAIFAEFVSCDPDIAEVDNKGVVHGLKEGKTHVLRIDNGQTEIIEVTVTKAPLEPGYSTSVNGIKYEVLSIGKKYGYVKVTGATKKMSSVYIPSTVKFRGKTFRVSRIAPGAFTGDSKVKYVRTGKYLKGVGDNAFYKCKNLAKVKFTSKKKPTIGYRAFSSVKKGCKFYVPKSQKGHYKKALKGKRIRTF